MNSIELRRQWNDLTRLGKFKDAIQTAIEIIRAEAGLDKITVLRSHRPLVMTLKDVAEFYPHLSEETLGLAEHYCKQMLELVPDDRWTWDHLREIRRKLHKGKVYENRCWKCKGGIDSLLCARCERCRYYQCLNCAACLCGFGLRGDTSTLEDD